MRAILIICCLLFFLGFNTSNLLNPVLSINPYGDAPLSDQLVNLKIQEGYIGKANPHKRLFSLLLLAFSTGITQWVSYNYWRLAKLFLISFIPKLKQRFNLYPRVFNSRLVFF